MFKKVTSKKTRLYFNKLKGKQAERMHVLSEKFKGNRVERTGRGSDYKVYTPHGVEYHEVKSGKAKLSKLQKRTRKRLKKKYKVIRIGGV